MNSTRDWIFGDLVADEMAMAAIQYKPQNFRMLRQLALTSERWEKNQELKLFATGSRNYQVSSAYMGEKRSRVDGGCHCSDVEL